MLLPTKNLSVFAEQRFTAICSHSETLHCVQGDRVVVQGDRVVVQGDRVVVRGDSIVVRGDSIVVRGDRMKVQSNKKYFEYYF